MNGDVFGCSPGDGMSVATHVRILEGSLWDCM